jgi:type IV pilus assembly protein PilF
MTRWICLLVVWLLLGGCITESTGGMPDPAPKPERVQAHLDLARGYLAAGDTDRARAPVETALKIDPKSADALVLMAVLYQREGDTAIAEDSYKKALRYHPSHPQALNNYGTFLYSQGRYEEAAAPLRKLVRNPDYPARAQAYENLGLTELKVGRREEAREAFQRSLSLSDDQPRSSLELADLAFQDGEVAAAQGYFDAFRVQARQTPRSLCLGVELARAEGDTNQAASYAMALKNLYPNSLEAQRCNGG